MNLNLGCGRTKIEGALGIDKRHVPEVDFIHNLDDFPWPFPDAWSDIVYAYDIIEHLDDVVRAMEEIHRILKPGGKVIIRTTNWQTENSFTDPTHKHYFTLQSFDFFDPDTFFGGKYGYYSDAKFKIIKREIQGQELYFELVKIFVRGLGETFYKRFPPKRAFMKLYWRYDIEGSGIIYGYVKSGRAIKTAFARQGVEFTEDAEVALSYIGADFYNRANVGTACLRATHRQNYKEYLFTMFEADLLPAKFVEGLRQADSIIAPSRHNADVFKRYAGGRPVHVCRLGIDPKIYKFKERHYPSPRPLPLGEGKGEGDNFRFLWLGSKSLRKGWDLVARAFQAEFRPDEPVELFIKTTAERPIIPSPIPLPVGRPSPLPSPTGRGMGEGAYPADVVCSPACTGGVTPPLPHSPGTSFGMLKLRPQVIYDDRDYSESALVDLYHSAHTFVFPTRGEGFGLPALEAMATGCLVIAPCVQGLTEFVNDKTALVVKYDWIEADYGIDILSPQCDLLDLRRQMRRAYRDYKVHSRKAKAGAKFAHDNLSWDHTAKRLIEIIWGKNNHRGTEAQRNLFSEPQCLNDEPTEAL